MKLLMGDSQSTGKKIITNKILENKNRIENLIKSIISNFLLINLKKNINNVNGIKKIAITLISIAKATIIE